MRDNGSFVPVVRYQPSRPGPPVGRYSSPAGGAAVALTDIQQVDDEDERLAGPDGLAGATLAITEVRRHDEPASAPDPHAGDPAIPSGDDAPGSQREDERSSSVPGGVELLAGRERHAHVVDDDGGAGHRLRAVADDHVLDDQVVGNREVGEVDLGTIQWHGRAPVRTCR